MVRALDRFISCDWGTSSLRVRLVEAPGLTATHEIESADGISSVFQSWKDKGGKEDRPPFYLKLLNHKIRELEQQINRDLTNIPVIISGMASSSMGFMELPYRLLPAKADGTELLTEWLDASTGCPHEVLVISGVRSENDVMRGEETQLVGAMEVSQEEGVFIFPGTHSKHVWVENGKVTALKTYMTGELFDLLTTKSSLTHSVDAKRIDDDDTYQHSFKLGVNEGLEKNLLNSIFQVRVKDLLGQRSKQENFHYLSGLLIGQEVRDLTRQPFNELMVVGNENLRATYRMALHEAGLNVKEKSDQHALIQGQYHLLKYLSV